MPQSVRFSLFKQFVITMKSRVSPIKYLKADQTSRRKDKSPGHSAISVRKEEFNPNLYISPKFNQEDITGIKEAFDSYDSNRSGLLTPNDLKVALFHQGFHASRQTVYSIIAEYDQDCLGGLNFQAFIKIISGEPVELESELEVKKVFRKMDKENKGYLDRRDIQNLLKSLGDQWDQTDLDVMFERLDAKQGRKVSFQQFKKIMHTPSSMY